MNTRDMQIFMKIAEYHSVTRAAEDVQMTQPAISSALKRLEEELGYPLFTRRGKWLSLNEQGRIVYEAAAEFLGEVSHIQGGLRVADHPKPEIVIRMDTHSDYLYALLGEFTLQHPEIRIVLRQGRDGVPEQYRHADFRIGLYDSCGEGQTYIPLEHRGAVYAILPENHPLSRKLRLRREDLIGEKFVFLRSQSGQELEGSYQVCRQNGIEPVIAMITDNNTTKYSAIRRGIGAGLIFESELSLAPLLKDCRLVIADLPVHVEWIGMIYEEAHLSEAGKLFLNAVMERI